MDSRGFFIDTLGNGPGPPNPLINAEPQYGIVNNEEDEVKIFRRPVHPDSPTFDDPFHEAQLEQDKMDVAYEAEMETFGLSKNAGKATGCSNQEFYASGEMPVDPNIDEIRLRMSEIKHKILILSGKGGVGKSSVTTSLAYALAADPNIRVGVLDVDLCGPSQARMFGVEGHQVNNTTNGWEPIFIKDNLCVMSYAFLLNNRNEAIVLGGSSKNGLIKRFLKDVDWDELDYLLIDTPPGRSNEHIAVFQLLLEAGNLDRAVIVTTPQEISLLDVRKEINFCQKTKVPILGVVENMCYHLCCNNKIIIFPKTTGGAKKMCEDLSLDLLAELPHDTNLATELDNGEIFSEKHHEAELAQKFNVVAKKLIEKCNKE